MARHDRGPVCHAASFRSSRPKVEIQIVLKALAFFAAFMAARSLTAYLKDKEEGGERGR